MQTSSLVSPAKTSGLTKNKFEFTNPRKNLQIVEDNFFKWSNDHMYRTSTHDMSDKVSGMAVCELPQRWQLLLVELQYFAR